MHGCIATEALGHFDSLPANDPKRQHVAQCARCSAMLVAYVEFMRADAPRAARMSDADAQLASFIAERVEGVEAGGASRRRFGRWYGSPSFRYVLAAASLVVVALVVARSLSPHSDEVVLRGDPHAALSVETRTLADQTVELRWTPVENADAYEVILLAEDLSEVVRLPAGSETSIAVSPPTLPSAAVRWQVTALREGAVIAESVPEVVRK